jgi:hypothetical protein
MGGDLHGIKAPKFYKYVEYLLNIDIYCNVIGETWGSGNDWAATVTGKGEEIDWSRSGSIPDRNSDPIRAIGKTKVFGVRDLVPGGLQVAGGLAAVVRDNDGHWFGGKQDAHTV